MHNARQPIAGSKFQLNGPSYRNLSFFRLDVELKLAISDSLGHVSSSGDEFEASAYGWGVAQNSEGGYCLKNDIAIGKAYGGLMIVYLDTETCVDNATLSLKASDRFNLSEVKAGIKTDGSVKGEARILSVGVKGVAKGSVDEGAAALLLRDALVEFFRANGGTWPDKF